MSRPEPLSPELLSAVCDPAQFEFETTEELDELGEAIGQARALEALAFGVRIRQPGFNLFALGPTGMGKHYVVRQFLEREALGRETPSDWCYVHNFDEPHRPVALSLPQGQGSALKADLARLIEDAKAGLASAFESEDYRTRKRVYAELLKQRQGQVIALIEEEANEADIAILRSPGGLALVPMECGEVMGQEAFEALDEGVKAVLEEGMERFREALHEALQQEPLWEREQRDKIRELNREVAAGAIEHLMVEVMEAYQGQQDVEAYLKALFEDLVEHAARLVGSLDDDEEERQSARPPQPRQDLERRYAVNVIVEHAEGAGAPVVYEDQPTVYNLIGRVEHRAWMGALMTDFSLLRAGSLHRANGGYLIMDAVKLLEQPHAWDVLKRALRSGEVRTESVEKLLDRVTTVSLEPMPLPLDVKVVLVGERSVWGSLSAQDVDFEQLFKVAVDFDEDMPRTPETIALYARLIATLARKSGLRPLDRGAVAAVIEHVGRVAGDNEKLSIHIQNTSDLLREADYRAGQEGLAVMGVDAVRRALEAKRRRSSRMQERMQERTLRGITLIATEGEAVGQINGLSVLSVGQASFGQTSRITAAVRFGEGEVLDIEREAELGGPLHSKGVFILTGFLGSRYAAEMTLSLSASIAMEQSYTGVDGDSATCAEACALLSALSGVPIKQGLAITGSMNQLGQVQAVGGVIEKIEGFFDLCSARGLTGDQGVLIPASNVPHLMLRGDLVDAAREGRFHVYPIRSVDEAIEILTGRAAGEKGEEGLYPQGSINRLVQDRLRALAEHARQLRGAGA